MSSLRGSCLITYLHVAIACVTSILDSFYGLRADPAMQSGHAGDKPNPVKSQDEAKPSSSQEIATAAHTLQQTSRQSSQNASPAGPVQSHFEASFLGIPGELRNLIYRNILLQPGMIRVSSSTPSQPAVLLTSRRIRTEALPIWLAENTFKVDAWDMRLSVPSNYHQHWLSRVQHKNFFITMRGKKDWKNLKGWLKRFAAHEVPGLASGQPTPETELLAQAFELVYCLLRTVRFEYMDDAVEAWIRTVELAGADFNFP